MLFINIVLNIVDFICDLWYDNITHLKDFYTIQLTDSFYIDELQI